MDLVLTVHELNRYVRSLLDNDPNLARVVVVGEIANFKAHPSGHLYFSLQDEEATVRAVMFRSRAERLAFRPENGQEVFAEGRVSLYERDGAYQLYVERLEPVGVGSQHLSLLQLKERLAAEGLFRAERKRALPRLPRCVGVVTSRQGAAFRDIVSVAHRRNPRQDILLAPCLVQGPLAPASLVSALAALSARPEVDVIILGRGGGAMEDLSAFNREEVVRAVASCRVPVVSAVGHEVDVTLVDFAADVRAPTPSAAAELVVPDAAALWEEAAGLRARAARALLARLTAARRHLDLLIGRRWYQHPEELLFARQERLDRARERLAHRMSERLAALRLTLADVAARLDALSPLAVLARGYAVLVAEGKLVRSVADLAVGREVAGQVRDGAFTATVLDVSPAQESAGGGPL